MIPFPKLLLLSFIFICRLIGVGLVFFIDPIWGIVLNILLDYCDGPVYKFVIKAEPVTAQYYDKTFDYLYYIALMIVIYAQQYPFWPLVLALFVFRSIGELIFFYTGDKRIFVYFPNFFEYYTLGLLLVNRFAPTSITPQLNWILLFFLLITVFRVWNELFLHKQGRTGFETFVLPAYRALTKPFHS